jgi:hypothetical protein
MEVEGIAIVRLEGFAIDILAQSRRAGITAWFDETLETTTLFELRPCETPALDRCAATGRGGKAR